MTAGLKSSPFPPRLGPRALETPATSASLVPPLATQGVSFPPFASISPCTCTCTWLLVSSICARSAYQNPFLIWSTFIRTKPWASYNWLRHNAKLVYVNGDLTVVVAIMVVIFWFFSVMWLLLRIIFLILLLFITIFPILFSLIILAVATTVFVAQEMSQDNLSYAFNELIFEKFICMRHNLPW
jgi:hypothetical protein